MSATDAILKLLPSGCYHIYNRGNNKETLFKEPKNYNFFLGLWKKYIEPVAETYCYNLLPNHFHFFIRTRTTRLYSGNAEILKSEHYSKAFADLFNAYAKAINKLYNRSGSLFQERFRRKEVNEDTYFTNLVAYIITNAVKHGFCETVEANPYSAYHALVSDKPTLLLRSEVLEWFGGKERFINFINNYQAGILENKKFLENEYDD